VVARVCKIKVYSNVETKWYRLTGGCNLTDLGMRTAVEPENLNMVSDHQEEEDMCWMKLGKNLIGRGRRTLNKPTW
jgi:hypothetical protein